MVDRPLEAAGEFLRLSRGTLEALTHHRRDRIAVRHDQVTRTRDARSRFKNQGPADGVQAARHGRAALAVSRAAAGSRRVELVDGIAWIGYKSD